MKRFVAIALLLFGSFSLFAQQWDIKIDTPSTTNFIKGGDVNEADMTVFAGSIDSVAWIGMVSNEGEFQERYFPIDGMRTVFHDARFISDDTMFVLGCAVDTLTKRISIRIVTMDIEMGQINDNLFPIDEECNRVTEIGKLMIDNDNTIVASLPVSWSNSGNYPSHICSFWRFTPTGVLLNCRYTKTSGIHDPLIYFTSFYVSELIKPVSDSGFIALGDGYLGNPSLNFFDYDFNLTEYHVFGKEQGLLPFMMESCYSGYWFDNEHLLVKGSQINEASNSSDPEVLVVKSDLQGNIEQQIEINRLDTSYFGFPTPMVAAANDSTIYLLVSCTPPGNWNATTYAEIYLINRDMELLGSLSIPEYNGAWPSVILRTHDDGCIVTGRNLRNYYYIRKYSREDFNPLLSVKEVPSSQIETLAYPNPASDEINIDISQIHKGGEKRIRVVNMSGQVFIDRIIRGEGNVLTLGVSSLPSGIYTYRIYNAEKEIVGGKFVKE